VAKITQFAAKTVLQQFSLNGGTVPNLETRVIGYCQIEVYFIAVKTAVTIA